ncbi:MAG: DUF2252 family protein [Myxococcota bacterium]
MRSPFALAARQIQLDQGSCGWHPELIQRKRQRLSGSAHAFLRGAPRLFYEILKEEPHYAEGPEGVGPIVGDMHLENVGAYRTDTDEVVFDLNDFDEAAVGPWRFDVLRATTSVILALHALDISQEEASVAARALLLGYRRGAFAGFLPENQRPLPAPMLELVESVRGRSKQALLDARAPKLKGHRRFVRGDRYLELPPEVTAELPALLAAYRTALGARAPEHAQEWELEDAAHRIAGNGSLGGLRVAMLVKEASGNERLIELKEAHPSVMELVHPEAAYSAGNAAQRVVEAARALVAGPPRMLAALPTTSTGHALIGRQLFPQEDKLMLSELRPSKLGDIAETVGQLLGRGHARAIQGATIVPWSDRDLDEILVRALELTGVFQAVYYAYRQLSTSAGPTSLA